MSYEVRLSPKAAKDLDRLDRPTQQRVVDRLRELAAQPFSPRLSERLVNAADQRKSRVGGWRIIFRVNEASKVIDVAMIERRGQVYQRLR